jgi:hypothetical protein
VFINPLVKNKVSKNGLSFKVHKEKDVDEEDIKPRKGNKGENFWNFQLLDRKRQSIL